MPRFEGRWIPAYSLFLLFLANLLNVADRSLLGIVVDPVKADLGLTDTEMSIIAGSAFVLFNLFVGIFIARWVDRGNRKRILILGITLWSAATALTGLAQGFASLALTRILVGVGEATAFPVAISLIADLFTRDRRPRAVGIFQSSIFVGVVIGSIAAGVLAAMHGWRMMFLICGAAGFALVLVMLLTMREPARGRYDAAEPQKTATCSLGATIAHLFRIPGFGLLSLGTAIGSMTGAVLPVWAPTFLLRSHGVDLAHVGLLIGPAVGIGGVTGTIASGMLASRLARKRGNELHGLLVPVIAMPIAVPFYAIFCFAPSLSLTVAAAAIMNFLLSSGSSPCFAAVLGLSPPSMRGVSSTIMLAASGVVGGAIAPLLVGAVSDALMPALGKGSLRYALATMLITPLLGAAVLWLAYRRSRLTQAIDSLPVGRPPLKPNET
jgi:MFS family permease